MAYSSAIRIGLVSGTMLPDWRMPAVLVRSMTAAAIRFGLGMSP